MPEKQPRPNVKPIECPHLRRIRDEAVRLKPGFLASTGHLGGALGAPLRGPAGQKALACFCKEHDLVAQDDGNDGVLFAWAGHPAETPTE